MSVNTFVWVSIKKDDAAEKVVIIFYETLTWNEHAQGKHEKYTIGGFYAFYKSNASLPQFSIDLI